MVHNRLARTGTTRSGSIVLLDAAKVPVFRAGTHRHDRGIRITILNTIDSIVLAGTAAALLLSVVLLLPTCHAVIFLTENLRRN